jgi:ubiquinone/menaquinone biosynthesis C-methylase UbiE
MARKQVTVLDRDRARANLLPYTRRAFGLLPKLSRPRILDIGCGTGVSTLELLRISDGDIVALDIDRSALDRLIHRAQKEGLSSRLELVHTSMLEIDFPPDSFDLIWTEGAIANIGFERGLRAWRAFLVPGGHLVVHDEASHSPRKIASAGACGYTLVAQFELPPSIWWNEYYMPLKKQIEALRGLGPLDIRAMNEIEAAEREIEEFDNDSDRFASVFFVLRKV